jgi:hypothetical protein
LNKNKDKKIERKEQMLKKSQGIRELKRLRKEEKTS